MSIEPKHLEGCPLLEDPAFFTADTRCTCPPIALSWKARGIDIEAAAKKLAERMDYPWQHMPEQGRESMREHVLSIIEAARIDHSAELQALKGGAVDPHEIALQVRAALDRYSCPNPWMVIAYEATVKALAAAPQPAEIPQQVTDGGRNPHYEGLFEGETEQERYWRLNEAQQAERQVAASIPSVSGLGRDADHPRAVVLYLRTEPSDDDMRAIQEALRTPQAAQDVRGLVEALETVVQMCRKEYTNSAIQLAAEEAIEDYKAQGGDV